MNFRLILKYLLLLIIVCAAITMTGCAKKKPIRIGFSEQLTGSKSDLGIQSRNGAQLAVANINASGGINGRPLELIIRDDHGTNMGAIAADRDLLKLGVVAIIGHSTSEQTNAVLPVINDAHIVLISPTASAPELSAKSKYFFRMVSSLSVKASGIAKGIYRRRNITRLAIIYDASNKSYNNAFLVPFTSTYKSLGGQITGMAAFSVQTKPDFASLLRKLQNGGARGLLILAGSYDAALIAQRTRLIGWDVPLLGTGLAEIGAVAKLGGKAVEGMEIDQYYNVSSKSPAFLRFKSTYISRYGNEPIGAAALGYETVQVLAAALKKTQGSANGLREALLETKNFQGLVEKFSFDAHGGSIRPPYYARVQRGGKPSTIQSVEPSTSKYK